MLNIPENHADRHLKNFLLLIKNIGALYSSMLRQQEEETSKTKEILRERDDESPIVINLLLQNKVGLKI